MLSSIKIVSRSSPLALVQVEEVLQELKSHGTVFDYEIIKIQTAGDKDKNTPLTQSPDNFFTDTIDDTLLEAKADVAVHSAKDLPQNLSEGLKIFALTKGLEDKDAWVSPTPWKDLPPNPKIGTSSRLRQQQILQLRPDALIVEVRGTIAERLQLVKDRNVDGVVMAACALKRLKLESEIRDIFPWEGTPGQGQLAVVGRRNDHRLCQLFSVIDVRQYYGHVTLVGAGPGDPDLMTMKGIKALENADCVFYDYLADVKLLKYAPQAEHIYAGKRKGEHSIPQEELSQLLKRKAMEGQKVVRLKGGDPLIFGRGADEIQYLRSYHLQVEVVPGISSATGIPSTLGIPLTARGISSSVAFVSGHQEDENMNYSQPVLVPQTETLVFLMGLTKLGIIVEALLKAGWSPQTPMMIIANGTKPEEQVLKANIATIERLVKDQELRPPALMIVGKTIEFYRANQRWLHCGTHPALYRHFGKIVHWPMIEIKPVIFDHQQQEQLLNAYKSTDIIVLTSWYAATFFLKIMDSLAGGDFSNKIFAVIGKQTAKVLEAQGIKPAIVAQEETAEGLFKSILSHSKIENKRILFPRSSLPNPFLKKALMEHGAFVQEITIYENTKPPKRALPRGSFEGVIFTSPSTVHHFLADYQSIPSSWQILAKGPVTLKSLLDAGYKEVIVLS